MLAPNLESLLHDDDAAYPHPPVATAVIRP